MRKVLVLGVVLAALLPAYASARPFTPELNRYYNEALTYWGLPPASNCVYGVEREVVPRASFGVEGRVGYGEACRIQIAEELVLEGTRCQVREVVFHETGHSVGLEHSSDPNSYMGTSGDWPMCRDWRAKWRASHPKLRRGTTIRLTRR